MVPGGGKRAWSVPESFWRFEDGLANMVMVVVVALRDGWRRRYTTRGDAPVGYVEQHHQCHQRHQHHRVFSTRLRPLNCFTLLLLRPLEYSKSTQ